MIQPKQVIISLFLLLFVSCKTDEFYDDFTKSNDETWGLSFESENVYDKIEDGLLKIKSYNEAKPLVRFLFYETDEFDHSPFFIDISTKIDTLPNTTSGLYWGDYQNTFYLFGFSSDSLFLYKVDAVHAVMKSHTIIFEESREIDMSEFHQLGLQYHNKEYSLIFDDKIVFVDHRNEIDYGWNEFANQFGFYTNGYMEADYIRRSKKKKIYLLEK